MAGDLKAGGSGMSMEDRATAAGRVTLTGFFCNIALFAVKMTAGVIGGSAAMVADAFHSLSDLATDIVVLVTMRMTRQPRDECHDYGHGKFETLATLLVGSALLLAGAGIAWSGLRAMYAVIRHGETLARPGWIAFAAAVVSVVVKESLYRWTLVVGRRIRSPAVIANAWHHRSDAFSSIGTVIGIGGAIWLGKGFAILDPVAGVVVSVFILRMAYQLFAGSIREMLECALDQGEKDVILQLAGEVNGVMEAHGLRTRRIGHYVAAELHILVSPDLTVREGHHIATNVESRIREKFGENALVTVHVEPAGEDPGQEGL